MPKADGKQGMPLLEVEIELLQRCAILNTIGSQQNDRQKHKAIGCYQSKPNPVPAWMPTRFGWQTSSSPLAVRPQPEGNRDTRARNRRQGKEADRAVDACMRLKTHLSPVRLAAQERGFVEPSALQLFANERLG